MCAEVTRYDEQFVILKTFHMLGCPQVQVHRTLTGEQEKHRLQVAKQTSRLFQSTALWPGVTSVTLRKICSLKKGSLSKPIGRAPAVAGTKV